MLVHIPSSLPEKEKPIVQKVVDNIYSLLYFNNFTFVYYVPLGKSCGDAATDRGKLIAQYLPRNWRVDTYAWRTGAHIHNIIYFQSSDGYYYLWGADGYGYPVTDDNVKYLFKTNIMPKPTKWKSKEQKMNYESASQLPICRC